MEEISRKIFDQGLRFCKGERSQSLGAKLRTEAFLQTCGWNRFYEEG